MALEGRKEATGQGCPLPVPMRLRRRGAVVMSVNLETETRLHLWPDTGPAVTAVRGDELMPEERAAGAVAFVMAKGWLNREDAAKLGRFLLEAAGEVVP